MMRNAFKLIMLLTGFLLISAQQQVDTVDHWRAKFAHLSDFVYRSKNANWIGIRKLSKQHGDSVYVINTKSHTQTVYRIGNSQLTFLNEEGVLGKQGQKVIFLNLHTGKTSHFDNVIDVYTLEQHNRYGLLFNDHHLRVYDTFGKQLLEIPNVSNLTATDSKNTIYASKLYDGKSEIVETTGSQQKVLYQTINKIRKMSLSDSGKQLSIIETTQNNDQDRLVIFQAGNFQKKILELNIPKNAVVNFSTLKDGTSYLISARVAVETKKEPLVDVWYGNDPYVNEHFKMSSKRNFWIWHPKRNELQNIPVPESIEVGSINNDRYFLTYFPRRGYNFLTSEPELNAAQIYDLQLNSYTDIGDIKLAKRIGKEWPLLLNHSVYTSSDGKWFLASQDGIKWSLYHSDGRKVTVIEKKGLEQPVFSAKSDHIYFESSNGLWDFNIRLKKLTALDIGTGKLTKIKNYTLQIDGYTAISFLPTEKLLAEIYDRDENVISYQLFQYGNRYEIIPATKNRIDKLIYDPSMTSLYTVEENYNLPPALFSYDKQAKKTLLFDGDIKDNGAKKIKQEIYNYHAAGKNLSGILFYPANFDPKKIYPMIVRIYDMQRHLSNSYLSPNKIFPEGMQIRTLLERGYFVFLPDTTVGEKGPGLSALECVHNALDAVQNNPSIDQKKIGLCGQSYGGYKTNFIATHSDRFAAYISGAGISDFIGNFYSYSINWNKPLYFASNTFYQMGTNPADDKERYLKNNPILSVEKVNAPILLWAGRKDGNVPYTQTMEFYIGLRRYKKDVVALFYQNGDHSFPDGTPEQIDLSKKVLDWFDYFLLGKDDIAWIDKQIEKDAE
ncbi:dipeptidyl aminopeptidase/acylaminoacyl peptidase [Chryseobacterium rhizosphaerae]|uniref:alpha/beta hydrolase family protein n=1 Tax=Chryseobacterium rhizosphaerae TaxID=395937 RepID=UPI002863BBF1|nr:prolyl oligopeptidase family serine peptidase [Chryseobacterium rhizosphaerae]MDR6546512.1 dipeptidyl aminopeptidase/acylaminoacyl peptidase [Chryseobacterium rhizosphaerae]